MFAILENIIRFHIEAVIAALIGLVCLIGGVILYNSAFRRPEEPDHAADLRRIEDAIEKLLQKEGARTSGMPVRGASSETLGIAEGDEHVKDNPVGGPLSADAQVQLDLLAAELESKKKEIENLRKAASDQDDKTPELLTKIKNLEDRLAEYEIIEDDIADLSKYKEENARLKRQLESLASGGAGKTEEVFSLGAETPASPEVLAEESPSAPAEPPAAVEQPAASSEQEEIASMAAELEKELGEVDEAPSPVAEEPMDSATASEEEAAPSGPTADMLAELTEAEESEEDPLAALGDIDTNKMLQEIQGLSDEAANLNLDDVPDVNKLADEAQSNEEER